MFFFSGIYEPLFGSFVLLQDAANAEIKKKKKKKKEALNVHVRDTDYTARALAFRDNKSVIGEFYGSHRDFRSSRRVPTCNYAYNTEWPRKRKTRVIVSRVIETR